MSKTAQWAYDEQLKEQEKMADLHKIEESVTKAMKQLEKVKDRFTTEHIVVHAYCLSSFVLLNKAKDYVSNLINEWEQKEFEDSYEPPNIPNETGEEDGSDDIAESKAVEKEMEKSNEKPFG